MIDETGGMVGATPGGMDHHILLRLSMKMTLNAKINMF